MLERIKEDRLLQGMLVVAFILLLLLIGKGGGSDSKEKEQKKEQTTVATVEKEKVPDTASNLPAPEELIENNQPSSLPFSEPAQVQPTVPVAEEEMKEEKVKEEKAKEEKEKEEKVKEEKVKEEKKVNSKPKQEKRNGNGKNSAKKENSERKKAKQEVSEEDGEERTKKVSTKKESDTGERISFKGYGLVCSIGNSCALLDPKSGTDYREGDTFKGWTIKSISPKGVVLEKNGKVIREEFE